MKLLTKINLYYAGVSLLVFAIAVVVLVFTVKYIINHEADERLHAAKDEMMARLERADTITSALLPMEELVSVKPIASGTSFTKFLPDTMIYNPYEEEAIPYHRLAFSVEKNGRFYQVTISKSHLEEEDIYESVITAVSILFLILLVLLFVLTRWVFSRTWRPFYQTLDQLRHFQLQQQDQLQLPDGRIEEYKAFKHILEDMTAKMQQDFQNLRDFTENASHELQTPLTVIRNKVEMVLQSQHLPEELVPELQAISSAASRLSSLNRALLLLSKIENRQFVEEQEVDIQAFVEKKFELYEELISMKKLTVDHKVMQPIYLKMNAVLADSLFTNLIYNSIIHNFNGGKISVELAAGRFLLSNTGQPPTQAPNNFFQRFAKSGESASHGLGLAIVKQICDYYDFAINYYWQDERHVLEVHF